MTEKITAIAAVEKIEKLIIELSLALDSAERFHKITKNKQSAAPGAASTSSMPSTPSTPTTPTIPTTPTETQTAANETGPESGEGQGETLFARQRVRTQQTPEEHDLRVKHCQYNRETIQKLNDRSQAVLNGYQADLKDHHHIDEGGRLLEIVQAIDDAIEAGHWQQGLFFRTIGEKLRKTREVFHDSAMLWHAHVQTEEEKGSAKPTTGAVMHTVYVSVYQSGGQSLKNWQYMLSHLAENTMGRPAYKERDSIEGFIRSRPVPSNEAYIVANVLEKDILTGMGKGPERSDNEGRPMLSLNKGAVKMENILEFVCSTGKYEIKNGQLIPLHEDS